MTRALSRAAGFGVHRLRVRPLLAASACVLALSACGAGGSGDPAASADAQPGGSGSRTLTVFAAASLNEAFGELGTQFESEHPGVRVSYNFGGSSDLAAQLQQGAPGDVFAAANEANMAKAVDDGLVSGAPTPFASNTLTIITAPGNPEQIIDLKNLAQQSTSGLLVVVCAPPVPCGAATTAVERSAGVDIRPVSEEQSVTDVLGKVTSGQADAGLVYATDAAGAGAAVATVDFPEAQDAVNIYPIATMKAAADPGLAAAYVDFITGATGHRTLQKAGFGAP